jgi:hypothetical protein
VSDEYQIEIPPSFIVLYTDARHRRTARERYDVCEDLANHLVEYANGVYHGIGVAQDEVLRRCRAGLQSPEAGVSADEALWVVRRLAELLGWAWQEVEPPV